MRKLITSFLFILIVSASFSQTWQEYNQEMLQFFNAGKLSEAIQSGEKAAEILKNDTNLISDYAAVLNNLAFMYLETKQLNKAVKTGREVLGEKNQYYLKLLGKIASLYSDARDYKLSDSLYSVIIETQQNTIGKNNLNYVITLNSLGLSYLQQKFLDKAKKVLLEAKNIIYKLYKKKHPLYADILNNLASAYYSADQQKKAEKCIIEANNILLSEIRKTISYRTIDETEAYLKMNENLINVYNSYYLIRNNNKPSLAEYSYNNALSRKGLMLQSEKGMRRAVLKTQLMKFLT